MAAQAPVCDLGWSAPSFALRATDGRTYSLSELKGEHGTLIMFICDHCPYVKAVIDRIVRDARELKNFGVNSADHALSSWITLCISRDGVTTTSLGD